MSKKISIAIDAMGGDNSPDKTLNGINCSFKDNIHVEKIKNKHVGTFGDIGTFSFFPGKNLGGFGDGGALITNSKKIFEYALRMRNHGAKIKYDHKNARLRFRNTTEIHDNGIKTPHIQTI